MHRTRKPGTSSIVNLISDSSSEEYFSFSGAPKRSGSIWYRLPKVQPLLILMNLHQLRHHPLPKYCATVDVEKVLLDMKDELFRSKSEVPVPQKSRSVVSMIFYVHNVQGGDNGD